MNYTVIGDAVNLSSRLCSFAKAGQIIVSESVFSALKNKSNFAFRELTPIHVKGKEDAVNVFEVAYFKNDSFSSIEEKHHQIEQFLISNLPSHLVYHSIDHIRDVVEKSELYGQLENLSEHKMHLLKTAAWLHDIGYIWDEKAHEVRGCQFAKEFLPAWGFALDEIDAICEMIMATRIPQTPTNLMQEILCDADLDYLGRDDYFMISDRLLMEIRRTNDLNSNDWKKLQLEFFNKHQYFTASANSNRLKGKQINAQKIAYKN
jgi:exopolyphosphatase/pppGpp-phosphohydrolase